MNSFAWKILVILLISVNCSMLVCARDNSHPFYRNCIDEALALGEQKKYSDCKNALNTSLSAVGINRVDSAYVYLLYCHVFMEKNEKDSLRKYLQPLVSLSMHPTVLKGKHGIQTIRDVSTMYGIIGESEKQLPLYSAALKIFESTELNDSLLLKASLLNGRYLIYGRKGQWKKALQDCESAINIKAEKYGETSPKLADNYSDLANIYDNLNYSSRAIKYYKKAIDIYNSMDPKPYSSIGLAENNLGYLYKSLHLQDLAYIHFNKAYESWVIKSFDSSRITTLYRNIGSSLGNIGHHKKAIFYLNEGIQLRQKLDAPISSIAADYILLARNEDNEKKKIKWYQTADSLLQLSGKQKYLRSVINNDLGNYYYSQVDIEYGDTLRKKHIRAFNKSSSHYKKAMNYRNGGNVMNQFYLLRNELYRTPTNKTLNQIKNLLPGLKITKNSDNYRLGLYTLGRFYGAINKLDSASSYFNKLLLSFNGIDNKNTYVPSMSQPEIIPLNKNNQKIFTRYTEFLIRLLQQKKLSNAQYRNVIEFAKATQKYNIRYLQFSRSLEDKPWTLLKESTDLLLHILSSREFDENSAYEALKAIKRYNQVTLIKPLLSSDIKRKDSDNSHDSLYKLRSVQSQLYAISNRIEIETNDSIIHNLKNQKLTLSHTYHGLQASLGNDFKKRYALNQNHALPLSEFKKMLDRKNKQFIFPFQDDSLCYIISATKKGVSAYVISGKADTLIRIFRNSLTDYKSYINNPHIIDSTFTASALQLYQKFLAKGFQQMNPAFPVGFVAQGIWQNLPLHLLLTEMPMESGWSKKPYLFKRYITYFTSGLKNAHTGLNHMEYDTTKYAVFGWNSSNSFTSNLPYVKSELTSIQSYNDAQIFWDSSATVENFLHNTGNYDIVHLATHGLTNKLNSEESYLSFYPDSFYNGKLSIGQIYHSYNPIDLLILSACNSGVENENSIPIYSSFNRAFQFSGVKSTVVSLWQISDKATADFMQSFYRNLKKSDDPLRAINSVYNEKGNDPSLSSHPYFWGGFIYYGTPEITTEEVGNKKWVWIVGLGLVLLSLVLYNRFRIA